MTVILRYRADETGVWQRRGHPPLNPVTDPGYVPGWGLPKFRDEFEVPGPPDPVKWNVRDRPTFGLLNDATIIAASQCVVTEDGLEIRGEWMPEAQWQYTTTGPQGNPSLRAMRTGYLEHRKQAGGVIYAQRWGMWEYRTRIPMAVGVSMGTLGAVWLRNDVAAGGEIDMTEGWGSGPSAPAKPGWYPAQPRSNAGRTAFTIHQATDSSGTKEAWTQPTPVYDQWVTYRFIYTPEEFSFHRKVDGVDPDFVEQFFLTPASWRSLPGTLSGPTPPTQSHFAKFWTDPKYDAPWHLRMNLHIGPSTAYWGVPDPATPGWTDDPTMHVRYVRIYDYDSREGA